MVMRNVIIPIWRTLFFKCCITYLDNPYLSETYPSCISHLVRLVGPQPVGAGGDAQAGHLAAVYSVQEFLLFTLECEVKSVQCRVCSVECAV